MKFQPHPLDPFASCLTVPEAPRRLVRSRLNYWSESPSKYHIGGDLASTGVAKQTRAYRGPVTS